MSPAIARNPCASKANLLIADRLRRFEPSLERWASFQELVSFFSVELTATFIGASVSLLGERGSTILE